jgi:hypothetical protein
VYDKKTSNLPENASSYGKSIIHASATRTSSKPFACWMMEYSDQAVSWNCKIFASPAERKEHFIRVATVPLPLTIII